MKKKLTLKKDTLRALVASELRSVVGASDTANTVDPSTVDPAAAYGFASGACNSF